MTAEIAISISAPFVGSQGTGWIDGRGVGAQAVVLGHFEIREMAEEPNQEKDQEHSGASDEDASEQGWIVHETPPSTVAVAGVTATDSIILLNSASTLAAKSASIW